MILMFCSNSEFYNYHKGHLVTYDWTHIWEKTVNALSMYDSFYDNV